jgi:hypothetical protein
MLGCIAGKALDRLHDKVILAGLGIAAHLPKDSRYEASVRSRPDSMESCGESVNKLSTVPSEAV